MRSTPWKARRAAPERRHTSPELSFRLRVGSLREVPPIRNTAVSPSEIDSIWFDARDDERLYFGHLFLLGAQKLLSLSRLAGFRLVERRRTATSPTSLALLPLAWPLVAATTLLAWLRNKDRFEHVPTAARRAIFAEHARLNLAPTTLLCKHLFWVLEKQRDLAANRAWLKSLTRATQA